MFIKFPVADADAEEPRLANRSLRNVSRSVLTEDVLLVLSVLSVLLVLLDELLAEAPSIAETRLLKSVFNVLRLLSAEEVEEAEEVPELLELAVKSEISASSLLEKVE
jgi:hypothetical protein